MCGGRHKPLKHMNKELRITPLRLIIINVSLCSTLNMELMMDM